MQKLLLLLTICLHLSAQAEFSLNTGLTESQRKAVLNVLGLGSSSKNISSLQPLGSDSGVEIAISYEIIDTQKINQYIADDQSKNSLSYPKIIIGKGIYNRLDLFFHFIPYTATFGISEFGTMLRYNFWQSENSLFYTTGILHANSSNFNNQLVSRNLGTDLMFGVGTRALSVFTTLGWTASYGKFVGGPLGITDSLNPETEEVDKMHVALGTMIRYDNSTFSLSYDYYTSPVYTIKVGILF